MVDVNGFEHFNGFYTFAVKMHNHLKHFFLLIFDVKKIKYPSFSGKCAKK